MKKTIFANVFESGVYASRLAAVAVIGVLAGCGTGVNGSFQSGVDNTPTQGVALHGNVHGGQQPVSGANIQLWAVGNTGYGSAATNLLTTPVTTQSDGSFSITSDYNCPSASAPVYITGQSGNPGNGSGDSNSQIMLAAALGPCGNLSSSMSIQINEVTTAATAFALGQYFTTTFGGSSTDSFGAPNTAQAQAGIANAFATVNNLANISTGAAVTSQTFSATTGTVSGDVVTVTPEYQKLNLIADILAACVNSDPANDNTNCTTLFDDVTPTGGTTPTDTLQAAVDMSLNPTSTNTGTSSIAALFALQTAQSPFVASALSAAPGDWTLGINYVGSSGSSSLTSKPVGIAIDASGNIWVVNNAGGATNNITEFSASSLCSSGSAFNCSGVPLYTSIMQVTTPSVNITSINPRNIAIDIYGNVFVPTSSGSGYMFEYNLANGNSAIALGKSSYGVAIDGNNDLFVGEQSSTATISFYEFNANSSPTASILATTDEVQYGNETGIVRPEYMAVDTSGNVWASSGVGTSGVQEMTGISTSGCTYPCTTPTVTYNTVTGGSLSTPFGLAAGPSGGMWIANSGNGTVSYLTNATAGTPYGSGTTWFNVPESVAVDGAGIAWVANHSTGSVSELTSSGTLLSPTSATNTPGFQHSAGLSGAQSIAVDPSGNVWVANNSTTAGIEEIVGAAAPTVTPIALALKNGTVGQKP